jgi:hypothetical protein
VVAVVGVDSRCIRKSFRRTHSRELSADAQENSMKNSLEPGDVLVASPEDVLHYIYLGVGVFLEPTGELWCYDTHVIDDQISVGAVSKL